MTPFELMRSRAAAPLLRPVGATGPGWRRLAQRPGAGGPAGGAGAAKGAAKGVCFTIMESEIFD